MKTDPDSLLLDAFRQALNENLNVLNENLRERHLL